MVNISNSLILCVLFIFASFTDASNAADPELQCPNNYTSTATQSKLLKQVFCKYNQLIRPVRRYNDSVDVHISLTLLRLDFNDKTDALTTQSLYHVWWHDYHLLWNSSEFDGIDFINVMSYMLWKPDLELYNTANPAYPLYYFYTPCQVYSLGDVICVPTLERVTSCAADLTRWPFDIHTCKMTLGSWTHTGEQINITLTESKVAIHDYTPNREWDLISTRAYKEVQLFSCCPNDTYPNINFEFVLRRHSGVYAATVILPVIVLMLMTLITFWIGHARSERLFIAVIDIFCHFMLLQYIGNTLPSNGNKTPLLVTFYRDSLILTTIALFSAILGRNLTSSSQPVPSWASGICSWILHNRFGQMMVLHNFNLKTGPELSAADNEGCVTSTAINSSTSSWGGFLTVLDSMCFIVILLIYVILMLCFIP